jgi:hypothetical protein
MKRIFGIWAAAALAACATAQAMEAPRSSEAEAQARNDAIKAAIARAAGAKMAVEAYHIAQNKFPANNAEVNLGAPDTYASGALKRLELQEDGEIQLVLGPQSGVDDGTVLLHPEPSEQSDQNVLQWTCTSPSYANIGDITGGACSFRK